MGNAIRSRIKVELISPSEYTGTLFPRANTGILLFTRMDTGFARVTGIWNIFARALNTGIWLFARESEYILESGYSPRI